MRKRQVRMRNGFNAPRTEFRRLRKNFQCFNRRLRKGKVGKYKKRIFFKLRGGSSFKIFQTEYGRRDISQLFQSFAERRL